jgi:di/tricarboxylate transporter
VRKDFLLVTKVGQLPERKRPYDYVPVFLFLVMMGVVVAGVASMHQAAMTLAALTVVGGWCSEREAVQAMDLPLLVLIAASLGLSKAIEASGLANACGLALVELVVPPRLALALLYTVCWVCTELVTNNAAAAMCFPIGMAMARNLQVSTRPFAVCVLFAASTSFCTPYGYATNLMVWGPGGYRFVDYVKVGLPLSLLYVGVSVVAIPLIWPF